ncbi:septal ring lytic transglycosylase RlpA family protein [Kordiimonas pumila]|uniref:Endolytic peptidoglycan transglycosylase RlpA n=1 Tax=Kordiimonas pumila TaxID=2161677 RepID=A0ABV7D1M6_9PROT|nr:septal ring lytic transglycosylase RlpA family protein [Kordiimonas pumila]
MFVAACSSAPQKTAPSGRYPDDGELPKGDQGVKRKVGTPYKVAGVWYHPKEDPGYDEVGIASWYGQDFHGKKTANGEYFNMNALTAAHKTLPLPTFVKVTNLDNNRSIILRVNDRGPFVPGRIIDISRRGAQLLGFDKQGTTRVRVQAVDEHGKPEKSSPRPQSVSTETIVTESLSDALPQAPVASTNDPVVISNETHYIQIGAYSQRANAEQQAERLLKFGHRALVEQTRNSNGTFWRVRVGPFVERLIAQQRLDRIVADGFYEARILSESVK